MYIYNFDIGIGRRLVRQSISAEVVFIAVDNNRIGKRSKRFRIADYYRVVFGTEFITFTETNLYSNRAERKVVYILLDCSINPKDTEGNKIRISISETIFIFITGRDFNIVN